MELSIGVNESLPIEQIRTSERSWSYEFSFKGNSIRLTDTLPIVVNVTCTTADPQDGFISYAGQVVLLTP